MTSNCVCDNGSQITLTMVRNARVEDDNRGQVGIGTLIVFIAMVLVAAIAAGVLINTAGFLQTQAEDTGTASTEQVADAINVITDVGEVGGPGNDEIHLLRIGVQPAAGAGDINLAELAIQYRSDENFTNLIVAKDASTGIEPEDMQRATADSHPDDVSAMAVDNQVEHRYGVAVLSAETEDDIMMTANSDRYEILINTSGEQDDDGRHVGPLEEGSDVELTITTDVGAQTVAFLSVPDSLSGTDGGETVNL